jgi:surface polysaccharide O-acyltransferase-like enzyme
MYLIIGLYLATPILRAYIRAADLPNIFYFVTMWFLFASLFPLMNSITGIDVGIHEVLFTGMIGYFLIGYLLMHVNFSTKYLWLLMVIAIGGILFTSLGNYYMTLRDSGQYNGFFNKLEKPNIIIISICIFLLFSKFQCAHLFVNGRISAGIKRIAAASFGIYLIHYMIIELLRDGWFGFRLSAITVHPAVGIPMTVITTMVISFVVVTLMGRIPIVKRLVP